jgi:DNA repair exonuclease SbcCD ATPase subunit
MFKINTLTVKNFMSVGNQTQAVHLDRDDLTLVLGENYDVGGGEGGARNGTGKTTIINALSYALYGIALTNIKRDNLINKTNSKGMLVTVEFERGGINYRIERGRKPNVLKFYAGDHEVEPTDDSAQGDSRETQAEIEKLLGMSHNMFKHIVALNTYTEPFLSMRANDQREIIEQLLGITQLSEKADVLKEQIKATKSSIQEEEYRIKAVQDANSRIEEQINSLKRRQNLWQKKHNEDLEELTTALEELTRIDVEAELELHRQHVEYNEKLGARNEAQRWLDSIRADNSRQQKTIDKLEKEISLLKEHKCYACGQDMHDAKQEEILKSKEEQKQEAYMQTLANDTQEAEHLDVISKIGELVKPAKTFYDSIDAAQEHRNTLVNLEQQIERKAEETDPYAEQIEEMQNEALQEISWDTINDLTRVKDHQEFLLKLLTNKDSFIRKRIIDQNLSYLNARLDYYLQNIGLPHSVEFKNDLSVEIQELGRDLDFDNLSRGERNRLILSLSWAFRDVWENLYQPINLLFIDELVDSGMDSSGVENSMGVLKHMSRKRNKSVWLVSHKDELIGRVNNVLKVIKENGFTSYNTDVEVA